MNANKNIKKKPFLLLILDGFGYSPNDQYNAIAMANTPVWDKLWREHPHSLLDCSGLSVGLPDGQMGNSEVGHMNISAGRIIYQDLTRIDQDIHSKNFFKNPELIKLFTESKQNQALHICGLLSDGGVHSHIRHFIAIIELARQYHFKNLYFHAFLDGRDTPPKSALTSLRIIDDLLKADDYATGRITSIIGRYYAMDRDNREERTALAYNLLTNNLNFDNINSFIYPNIESALQAAYNRGETDEFVKPTLICNNASEYSKYQIKLNDNVLCMNFRSDRMRQLCKSLKNFNIDKLVTLTQYEAELTDHVVYKPQSYTNMLGEYLSKQHKTQLRIAETEKYAHVTFFFNGGTEAPYAQEDRILIPSPKVSTYNLKPEMSAEHLTSELCTAIASNKYDAIICNYANPDMVGHTGDLAATIKAIEFIDQCLAKVVSSINKSGGQLLITADHGNAEYMYDEQTKQTHTAHTHSVVPLVYYSAENKKLKVTDHGSLTDIAPTMLHLMGLAPPEEMTGNVLFHD